MAAAAEISCHPAYIHQIAGTHTYLVHMGIRLVKKNGTFHPVCDAQLIHNSFQIPAACAIKFHVLLPHSRKNAFAVHKGNAFKKRPAQNLILDIGFPEKALINNSSEINALGHHLSSYLHGVNRGIAVFKYIGIMNHSGVQTFCHRTADLFLIKKTKQHFTGRARICQNHIFLSIACVGYVMIQADAVLCLVKIYGKVSQTGLVPAV